MIADVITNTASFSLPALLTIALVFGFAPGVCMRLIVLMYPRTDPRRQELYAELKAVPRIERPLWVAEQLETGLFDGLSARRRSVKARKRPRNGGAPVSWRCFVHGTEIRLIVDGAETIVSLPEGTEEDVIEKQLADLLEARGIRHTPGDVRS